MLDKLHQIMVQLPDMVLDIERWDSLIVNLRKPHTYRVWTMEGDLRICLHRFELCDSEEAFAHPHPWPAAFKVLEGHYRQTIWTSATLDSDKGRRPVADMVAGPGFEYSIESPLTWHNVQPIEVDGHKSHRAVGIFPTSAFSVMVNSAPWPKGGMHVQAPTTAGKDLDRMSQGDLENHLGVFGELLGVEY